MIRKFVDRFMAAKPVIEAEWRTAHPEDYTAIVKRLIEVVGVKDDGSYDPTPDPERITVIDHGDHQGTRLYIIGETGYQPGTYWSIFVNYGSCSGCDTFEAIHSYGDEPVTDEQVKDYWTMMLHMVQDMRELLPTADAVARCP